ncbi:hypothetical protein ACFQJC_03225 [Haloferax namakaokahaiae]|uniref:Uncharacterized protein n=1 Tax=Haloferax namakaokahaiae TaxID=1748331 RepID=A0ABD5ZBG6_9EURY
MPRPFRLFTVYDFFSVFLPGLATVLGLFMILPEEIDINFFVALIPILVLSFVFGQALHSLSALSESLLNSTPLVTSHRTQFSNYILENGNEHVVTKFKECCAATFRDDSLLLEEGDVPDASEWKSLYPFVQSRIYTNGKGRSRTFQAIFAFSRSMSVFLFGLPILYLIHYNLSYLGLIISRPPKYLLFFPNFQEFIEAVWPLSWMGMAIFIYSSHTYKKHFSQYLVSDFVSIELDD